jgi:hypothetical protein
LIDSNEKLAGTYQLTGLHSNIEDFARGLRFDLDHRIRLDHPRSPDRHNDVTPCDRDGLVEFAGGLLGPTGPEEEQER